MSRVILDDRIRNLLSAGVCQLLGYRGHVCADGYQIHHIINDTLTQNNKAARELAKLPELLAVVCGYANRERLADEKEARRLLILQAADWYGPERLWALLIQLPADYGLGDTIAELEAMAPGS